MDGHLEDRGAGELLVGFGSGFGFGVGARYRQLHGREPRGGGGEQLWAGFGSERGAGGV